MQTFLTHFSDATVFRSLDRVRHSKQRSEAIHILETLLDLRTGYANHPIMAMWAGYEPWLASYALMCCHAYRMKYGFEGKNKYNYFQHVVDIIDKFDLTRQLGPRTDVVQDGVYAKGKRKGEPRHRTVITPGIPRPEWRRDTDLLESHRSNLCHKEAKHYGPLFGDYYTERPRWPYLWPENDPSDNGYILRISKADRDRLSKGERVLPDHLEYDPEDGIIL